MKYLFLFLFAFHALAADDQPEFLSDQELSNKFVSSIHGTVVEDQLIGSSEFKECAELNKFDPKKTRDQQYMDTTTANSVQECFKNKLKGKKADDLKKLSTNLNLSGYQLIRSQNVQDITNTLSNRLYKKMTGIDLEERDVKKRLQSMSFKNPNRKIVDQKDFAELYRIQLGKSALYEISRFCFTNLRRQAGSGQTQESLPSTFKEHWVNGTSTTPGAALESMIGPDAVAQVGNLTDVGKPEFGNLSNVGSSKDSIYTAIKDSFSTGNNFTADQTKNFFTSCMKTITPLCKVFRDSGSSSTSGLSKGSTACLVQDKLQRIRGAMADTSKVLGQFAEIASASSDTTIQLSQTPNSYNSRDRENGYNALSTMTSDDFLVDTTGSNEDKLEECTQNPDADNCEGFLIQDDSYKKAIHDTDMNLRLKSEVEAAAIRELNGKDLKDYLKEKGYLELLKISETESDPNKFDIEVKKFFDAQRRASLEAIQSKVGLRQVDSDESDSKKIEDSIKENVKVSKEEKARLAQVVLFTNIVTSNLTLLKKDGNKTKVIGQNTLGLSREQNNNSQFSSELFENIRGGNDENESSGTEDYLSDIDFLDQVIGGDAPPSN